MASTSRRSAARQFSLATAAPRSATSSTASPKRRGSAQQPAETALTTDLLIIGGGVAGLAAAEAAAQAGHSVILVERRPWLGGDARYFGPVGDEASPEAVTTELIARTGASRKITIMTNAEVFALHGTSARVHQIVDGRGTVIVGHARTASSSRPAACSASPSSPAIACPASRSAIAAYHLAKRYGVGPGRSAIVATQSNYGYRLALRLHDAGVAIRRIVDPRVNPQSRFVDFAKASGLKLAGGQLPIRRDAAARAQAPRELRQRARAASAHWSSMPTR